ncbi:MAG TPA: serine/threonine protein kinase, partial [Anaerolineaceae bacterium]|nr:serine/threonine protein kinase [Anaerolineaceae bacterium]
ILWAMGLHPSERPESVEQFRQSLLGDHPTIPAPYNRQITLRDALRLPPERSMAWVSLGLVLLSLVLTLLK